MGWLQQTTVSAFPYPIGVFLTTSLLRCGDSFAYMTSYLHLAASDGDLGGEGLPIGGMAGDHGGRLSSREVEILRLIALGYTSAEIAAKLHLSRRTVETHRARIFQKLELRTRAELVRFALDHRLIGA